MVRLSTLYNNFSEFLRIANYVQGILTREKEKAKTEVEKTSYIYLQNRITEAVDRVHMGLLFSNTCLNLAVTDLDYIVSVDGKIKAIIEQKRRRCLNGDYIRVNNAQYEVLKTLWEKTGVPVYYLVKTWNGGFRFHFVKLNFWRAEITGSWQTRDNYAMIPISEGLECDEKRLVDLLGDILEGSLR
jgi:hypothetical protein